MGSGIIIDGVEINENTNEVTAINAALKVLPPGGGGWTVPQIQQAVGLFQGIKKFYLAPDEAIRHNRENARVMFRNLVIREPLQSRLLSAAELDWHVEPEDKKDKAQVKVAEDIQGIIQEIPDFLKYRYDLLLAVWFGRYGVQNSYAWDYSTGRKRLVVKEWQPVHGDSLVYKWDSSDVGIYVGVSTGAAGTKQLATEPGQISRVHVLTSQDVVYHDENGKPYVKLGLNERDAFVIHTHDLMAGDFLEPEAAGGVKGLGIRSVVYWHWYILQEIFGWLIEYMERVGTGITFYKYLRGNQESFNAAKILAESQSNQSAIMVPVDATVNAGKPMEYVERMEPGSTPIDNIMKVIDDYLGSQIRRYIVGQDATSRPVPSGLNSGVAQAHENSFNRIIRYDAINLQETLTHQLVRVLLRWNHPQAKFKCKFVVETEKPEIRNYMDAVATFVSLGGKVDEDEVRATLGLSKPDSDANILSPTGGPPPGGPPAPPGASPPGGTPGGPPAGVPAQQPPPGRPQGQWVPHRGKRGGRGFRNTVTGEIRRSKAPPGGRRPKVSSQQPEPAKLQYEAAWDEAKHPRADDGEFSEHDGQSKGRDGKFGGSGGGKGDSQEQGGVATAEGKAQTSGKVKDKKSAIKSLAKIGAKTPKALLTAAKALWLTPDKIEHVVSDFAKTKFSKPEVEGPPAPPTKLQKVGKAVWFALRCGTKAAFATWTAVEAAAEKVAKLRGATDIEAAALRHTLLMEDAKIYKAGALAMHLIPGGSSLEVPFAFIPVASLSYLAYAGSDIMYKKAKSAVKTAWDKLQGKLKTKHSKANLEPVFDAIQEHEGGEYYTSLLFAAFDLTHDWEHAVQVANTAFE